MTTTCCICQSATLINRQNLRTLAALAGVLDVVLRDYGELQRQQSGPSEPWTLLGDLVEQLSEKPSLPSEGLAQGLALAANIEKHWLGEFDSLCLNCGFLLTVDATSK
ncbi:hypothetical protein CK507_15655 [Pseudomonas sp. WN033]|nr:hypothetical protein CK507_15655 [Pseudomonas sp. WN033]